MDNDKTEAAPKYRSGGVPEWFLKYCACIRAREQSMKVSAEPF